MTQTPASGPFGPVTTPPISSGSIATAALEPWRTAVAPIISAQVAAITAAWRIRAFIPVYSPSPLLLFFSRGRMSFDRGKLPEHCPEDKPDVCGPFGQPSHVPGEPVFAVADQHPQPLAVARQPRLLPA